MTAVLEDDDQYGTPRRALSRVHTQLSELTRTAAQRFKLLLHRYVPNNSLAGSLDACASSTTGNVPGGPGRLRWGAGLGCAFVLGRASRWPASHWCDLRSLQGCTADHRMAAACNVASPLSTPRNYWCVERVPNARECQQENDGCRTASDKRCDLPRVLQHFRAPGSAAAAARGSVAATANNTGGSSAAMDHVPVWEGLWSCTSVPDPARLEVQRKWMAATFAAIPFVSPPRQAHCPTCRCIVSTLAQTPFLLPPVSTRVRYGLCARVNCVSEHELQIGVDDPMLPGRVVWLLCPPQGGHVAVVGLRGELRCPPASSMCTADVVTGERQALSAMAWTWVTVADCVLAPTLAVALVACVEWACDSIDRRGARRQRRCCRLRCCCQREQPHGEAPIATREHDRTGNPEANPVNEQGPDPANLAPPVQRLQRRGSLAWCCGSFVLDTLPLHNPAVVTDRLVFRRTDPADAGAVYGLARGSIVVGTVGLVGLGFAMASAVEGTGMGGPSAVVVAWFSQLVTAAALGTHVSVFASRHEQASLALLWVVCTHGLMMATVVAWWVDATEPLQLAAVAQVLLPVTAVLWPFEPYGSYDGLAVASFGVSVTAWAEGVAGVMTVLVLRHSPAGPPLIPTAYAMTHWATVGFGVVLSGILDTTGAAMAAMLLSLASAVQALVVQERLDIHWQRVRAITAASSVLSFGAMCVVGRGLAMQGSSGCLALMIMVWAAGLLVTTALLLTVQRLNRAPE